MDSESSSVSEWILNPFRDPSRLVSGRTVDCLSRIRATQVTNSLPHGQTDKDRSVALRANLFLMLLARRASFRACAGLPVEIIPTYARMIHLN